jgi:hypothetical protein
MPSLSKPNVLVLVIDCLRADHAGANGYHGPTTPTIDGLAAEGVSPTQAISPSSWTRPTMPALLTGLYPSEHGLIELERDENGSVIGTIMSPGIGTLAERLKVTNPIRETVDNETQKGCARLGTSTEAVCSSNPEILAGCDHRIQNHGRSEDSG